MLIVAVPLIMGWCFTDCKNKGHKTLDTNENPKKDTISTNGRVDVGSGSETGKERTEKVFGEEG